MVMIPISPVTSIKPRNNIVSSYDAYMEVEIASNASVTIDVYIDGAIDPFYQITTSTGVNVYQIPLEGAIPSSPDNSFHTIEFKISGLKIAELPLLYIDTTKTFDIVDENDNPLYAEIHLFEIEKGTLSTWYGSILELPGLSELSIADILEKAYVEILAYKDGKKYYLIRKIADLLEDIQGSDTLKMYPSDNPQLVIILDYNGVRDSLPDMLKFVGEAIDNFVLFVADNADNIINNYPDLLGRLIAKSLGITLKIVKIEVDSENNEIRIYFEQDLSSVAIALVIGVLIGVVIMFAIKDMFIEHTTYQPVERAYELDRERLSILKEHTNYCKEHSSTVDEYIKCVTQGSRALSETLGDFDTPYVVDLYYDYKEKETESDKWKTTAIVVGVLAVAILLIGVLK